MSQDIVADALNKMLNAKKARKENLLINMHSKMLVSILAIAKLKGDVKDYKIDKNKLNVDLGGVHFCKAIKPRFVIGFIEVEKYVKRFLPAKNIGIIIISTSEGLMTHQTAMEKNLGGSLIAYFY